MRVLNRQNGETIVEVLISVAVLGLMLATTYTLANKSTQANRQAQERTEALNENSARIERFKTYLENGGDIPSGTFCVFEDASRNLKLVRFSGNIPPNPNNDSFAIYPNQCKSGTDNRYNTSVRRSSPGTYVFTNRWFRVAGGGVEELAIIYRIYNEDDLGPGGVIPDPAPTPAPEPEPEPEPEPTPGPVPGPCYKGC